MIPDDWCKGIIKPLHKSGSRHMLHTPWRNIYVCTNFTKMFTETGFNFYLLFNIPNEFLKYGGDIMIKSLSDLFTCISGFEMMPDDWCKGIIKPLHKSGSIYDLDNYRGITLTSNVNKVQIKRFS
jgi:hypothetical protein